MKKVFLCCCFFLWEIFEGDHNHLQHSCFLKALHTELLLTSTYKNQVGASVCVCGNSTLSQVGGYYEQKGKGNFLPDGVELSKSASPAFSPFCFTFYTT